MNKKNKFSWAIIKNKIVKGFFAGIEDASRKFTLSIIGALLIATITFFATNAEKMIFANLFSNNVEDIYLSINEAKEGEIIEISNGIFESAHFFIDKNITLKGSRNTVFLGKEKEPIIEIAPDVEVTIENISFMSAQIGILAKEGSLVEVKNCFFSENEVGLEVKHSFSVIIENNLFDQLSSSAISIAGSKGIIKNNTIGRSRIGIALENSSFQIHHNLIKNSTDHGLYLFSDSSVIFKNIFKRVFYGAGINFRKGKHQTEIKENIFSSMKIGLYSIADSNTKNIKASFNTFSKISENVILLTDIAPNNFFANKKDDFWDESIENEENIGYNNQF